MTDILSHLGNDDFRNLVAEDVRGRVDIKTSKLLRTPLYLQKWHDCLLTIKRNVEHQLASDKAERYSKRLEFTRKGNEGKIAWLQYVAERERWRANNIFFKNGVENKLAEAKNLLNDTDSARERISELQGAIRAHKHTVETGNDDAAYDADEILWGIL